MASVPALLSGADHHEAFNRHYIRHTKGRWAGDPFVWEAWQRDFYAEALEINPATGLRVYTEVGLGIPRKNGKSTMASSTGLYLLTADGEPEPEVYVAAAAKNQAGIVMGQARRFVQASPRLLDICRVYRYSVECPSNGGSMRSVSSEAPLQHGLSPHGNIVDELHAHESPELYTALTTGTGAREQPLTLWITTAGLAGQGILSDLYDSMFSGTGDLDERSPYLKVYRDRRNGVLIYWYGAAMDADIEDPAVWFGVNPSSWMHEGDYLARQYGSLKARGAILEWRRYHLNQFVGLEDTWLPEGAWQRCRDPGGLEHPLNPNLPVGVGIDKGQTSDQSAIVVAQRQGDLCVVRLRIFPPDPSTGKVNSEAMRAHLRDLKATYPQPMMRDASTKRPVPGPAFAFDRWMFSESAEMLEQEGLNMVDFPQHANLLAPATGMAYDLINDARLRHDGDPVLTEHVRNSTAILTERGMKIAKPHTPGSVKNDGAVAMVMAIALGMAEAPVVKPRTPRYSVGF